MSDNKRTADLIQQATFADIYDKCTGYLELVRDGHLSLDDAWDAIPGSYNHLRAPEIKHDIVCRLLV